VRASHVSFRAEKDKGFQAFRSGGCWLMVTALLVGTLLGCVRVGAAMPLVSE